MAVNNIEKLTSNLTWYMHSCIAINGSKRIYFDPYGIPDDSPKADYVLTSHPHLDHYSLFTINSIMDDNSVIFLTEDSDALIKNGEVVTVTPNNTFNYEGITVKTIPAYNIDKRYHPKENNWVGYVLEMDGIRYYFAGDTDFIPEMEQLEDIDVAFLPIGGYYTMDHVEALKAVDVIKPKVAIPIHFGMIIGTYDEGEEFVNNCSVPATILKIAR